MNRHNFIKLAQQIGNNVSYGYDDPVSGEEPQIRTPDPERLRRGEQAKRELHPGFFRKYIYNPAKFMLWDVPTDRIRDTQKHGLDDLHDVYENWRRSWYNGANNLEQTAANALRLIEGAGARMTGGQEARDRVNAKWDKRLAGIDKKYKDMYRPYANQYLETNGANNFMTDAAGVLSSTAALGVAGKALNYVLNPTIANAASPVLTKVMPYVNKARQASKIVDRGIKGLGLAAKGLGATNTGNLLLAPAADPIARKVAFGTENVDMSKTPTRGLLNLTPLGIPMRLGMYLNDMSYGMEPGTSDYGESPVYMPNEKSQLQYFTPRDENGNVYTNEDGSTYHIPYVTVKSVDKDKSGRQTMVLSNGDTVPIPAGYVTMPVGSTVVPGYDVAASPIGHGLADNPLNGLLTGMNPIPIVDAYDAYVAARNENYNNEGKVPLGVPWTDAAVIGGSALIPGVNSINRLGKWGNRAVRWGTQLGQLGYYPYIRPRMLEGVYGVDPDYSNKEQWDEILGSAKYLPEYLWSLLTNKDEDEQAS